MKKTKHDKNETWNYFMNLLKFNKEYNFVLETVNQQVKCISIF